MRLVLKESFEATHSLVLGGSAEPPHGHEWRVRTELDLPREQTPGQARLALHGVLQPFRGRYLNELACFAQSLATPSVSAEAVARIIFDELDSALAARARCIRSVAVEEEPGCWAR